MRQLTAGSRGIGLRTEHAQFFCDHSPINGIDFLEVVPENWMAMGGRKRDLLDRIATHYPLIAHGLSLSIAGTAPLDIEFIKDVGQFLDDYGIDIYSDHLSISRDVSGYLYDLLPVPRRAKNIDYIAVRIDRVQQLTGRQLVIENISYYHCYDQQMAESDFLSELVLKSGCGLLLDINNAYVNAQNHQLDPLQFIRSLPSDAIVYYHIAGHLELEDGSLLDTHGTPVCDEVMQLAGETWSLHGPRPLLLERDNFVPSVTELVTELSLIHDSVTEKSNHVCHA